MEQKSLCVSANEETDPPSLTNAVLTVIHFRCILQSVQLEASMKTITITAKELRVGTSAILKETQKGNEVMITLRGRPAAILKPIGEKEHTFRKIGFGLWKDRKDMEDPGKWLDDRRKERKDDVDAL
jgi:antitoxin (DNA-binding transcriptional repressor) of toxin-antitoxin stability system